MAGEVASGYVKVSPKVDKNFKTTVEASMPDGTKMGGKVGKAFFSGFKAPVGQLAGWFKGGAVMGAVSSITTAAMGSISSSMDSAIARADTLANFPRVMTSMGYSADAAAKSTEIMKKAVDGLPTKLQDMTSNVQMLTSSMRNLSDGEVNATTVGKAFNDMMLAGGKGTEVTNEAFNQLSKIIATGKVEMDSWMSIYTASPGTIDKVAESLLGAGKGGMDLKNALTDGKVSMNQFLSEMVKLDKEGGDGFESFETQARAATKGIATSMSNAKNAVSNQMANILGELNKNGEIAGIFDGIKATIIGVGGFFTSAIQSIKDSIDFEGFKGAFDALSSAVSAAFGGGEVSAQDFGTTVGNAINAAIPVIQMLTPVLTGLAGGFSFLAQNAQVVAPIIAGVAVGLLIIKGVAAAAGMISAVGAALTKVGVGATRAAGGLGTAGTASKAAAPSLLQVGGAALMIGVGILAACAGIWLLANAAVAVAEAGPGAALALFGMIAAIAGLALGASVIGPALTAAAPGILAFGAAIFLIGAGVGIAAWGLSALAGTLPMIAAFGMAAGAAAMVLGAGLIVLGAGALVAGIGVAIFGAALLIAAPGLLIASVAGLLLGVAMMLIGTGAVMAAGALSIMAASLPAIAANAAPAGAGLGILAAACFAAVPGLAAGAAPAAALAAAIVPMGISAMMAAMGLLMISAALPMIASGADAAGAGFGVLSEAASAAAPVMQGAAPSFSDIAASIGTLAQATMTSAISMASLSGATQSAASGMASLSGSMVAVSATGGAAFSGIAASASAAFSSASASAQRAVSSIRSSLASLRDKTVRVNVSPGSVKLPHFSMTGSFDPQTGGVPHTSVSWYKSGAIFTKPTLLGNGSKGVGDAGAEVAMPLYGRYMRPFASAIASEMESAGGTVNNINIRLNYSDGNDAKDMARDIGRQLRLQGIMG